MMFGALVALTSSCFGIFGALKRNEMPTRIYFIFQMWTLMNVTMYLYFGADKEYYKSQQCTPEQNFGAALSSCDSQRSSNQGCLVIAVLNILICIVSANVALDYNDALNDH